MKSVASQIHINESKKTFRVSVEHDDDNYLLYHPTTFDSPDDAREVAQQALKDLWVGKSFSHWKKELTIQWGPVRLYEHHYKNS